MASFATAALGDATVAYSSKWVLSYVVDTHSNWVIYDYDCTDGTVCYPKTVSYGPYQVTYNMVLRPDPILMANRKTISRNARRIRSIKVTANGQTVSALLLGYDTSPGSGNSRLTAIRRYSSEAVIDGTGSATSGSVLPDVVFDYREYSPNYVTWEKSVGSFCTFLEDPQRTLLTDIDNDGIDELLFSKYSCTYPGSIRLFIDNFKFSENGDQSGYKYTGALMPKPGGLYSGNFEGAYVNKSLLVSDLDSIATGIVTFAQNLAPTPTFCPASGILGRRQGPTCFA
jgi:hypothetical protein